MGATIPGNSTVLRTATMMSASTGSGGKEGVPSAGTSSTEACVSLSATRSSRLLQCNQQATIDGSAMDRAVISGGQRQAAMEPSLRQLEPVNGRRTKLARQKAGSADDQMAILDDRLGLCRIDPGQRDQHEDLMIRFQDVDRRRPSRKLRRRSCRPEEFSIEPFRASQQFAG